MKRFHFILFMMLIAGILFGQKKAFTQTVQESAVSNESFPMDGGPALEKFYKANGIDLAQLAKTQPILKKITGPWNFSLNQQHIWIAANLDPNKLPTDSSYYHVITTCRAVGAHCYIFVEDSSWQKGRVDSNAVNQIENAFDNSTPANPSKGVYQMDVDTFGNPPDVDNDPKIIILILNIRDGYVPGTTGGYTAGYFDGTNEMNLTGSNHAEIYYMDCYPMNLNSTSQGYNVNTAMQITAHEFQHMIQWNYHRTYSNSAFFNEGCSMIAEVVCGYPLRLQSYYSTTSQTNVPMMNWSGNPPGNVLSDYARAARFFLYIKEQFGVSALTKFVQSALTDINAFNVSVFPVLSPSRRFNDVVTDWWIANVLNNKSADPKWGYDYPALGTVSYQTFVNPNMTNFTESVYKIGVKYYKFISGKNLNINLNTNGNSSIQMKAIKIGSSTVVSDLTTNANNNISDFGTTYPNVILMVYHNDQNQFLNGPFSYSMTTSATFDNKVQELAYDVGLLPQGVLSLSVGDSVAVVFDGVANAKLDSIRVALRQAGSVSGGVYSYIGQSTRLGGKALAAPITVTSTIAQKPSSPYPDPWPNWVKYDLRSYNIAADNSFVVMFVIEGAYPAYNRVMITDYQSSSWYHSSFYRKSTGDWIFYTDSGNPGYIFLNLIRAYVSFGPSDVKQVVELKPASFKLEQNYPNPFNPSTIISYQLSAISDVKIKIFDVLGQEIATLVNEEKPAGKYQTVWNGTDNFGNKVTSGVYFYTVKAGNNVETKKMILMK